MAEKKPPEEEAPEVATMAEEAEALLHRLTEFLQVAITIGDDGPFVDLDLLTRLMLQRAIPYRTLNREVAFNELRIVREEQNLQKVRADNDSRTGAERTEARNREAALRAREKEILDQLWPL